MVRKLLRSVREYKKHSILAPVFVIFEVIMEVVIPLLMANLIDFGIDDGNLEYIVKMGVDYFFINSKEFFPLKPKTHKKPHIHLYS